MSGWALLGIEVVLLAVFYLAFIGIRFGADGVLNNDGVYNRGNPFKWAGWAMVVFFSWAAGTVSAAAFVMLPIMYFTGGL